MKNLRSPHNTYKGAVRHIAFKNHGDSEEQYIKQENEIVKMDMLQELSRLKDIKLDIIKSKTRYLNVYKNRDRFVRVEHIPSGITVTKYHKSQIEAKKLAMLEINELIDLWENCI